MKFIKENKLKIALCALITVLPSIVGLCMLNTLIERTDMLLYGGRGFLIFSLIVPLVLLVLFAVGMLLTLRDNRCTEQSTKVLSAILLICPVISISISIVFWLIIFEKTVSIISITSILFAALFIILGNYMPKCKQNLTIGVKTRITLANEENWNKTHRFTGKAWFVCGILALVSALLPLKIAIITFLSAITLAAIAPPIYSYAYYRHQLKTGAWVTEGEGALKEKSKKIGIATTLFVSLVLVFVLVLMFTGDVTAELGEDSLTLDATYSSPLVISYADIDSAEICEDFDLGVRVFGFGSPRLSVGTFKNSELSSYTVYSYTSADVVIILNIGGKTVAFAADSAEATREIYNNLCKKLSVGE